MDKYAADIKAALASLEQHDIIGRLWRKDHTVWKPSPAEISNRLGWLGVADLMRKQAPALQSFAWEVRDDGFRHVVLLGMGGSSLGAEVLRQVFGSAKGHPELIVLDSTLPATVQATADAINPAHTLFLVSSKSGTTTEPLALYDYFHSLVDSAIGKEKAGRNFAAITDAGSPLSTTAQKEGFRRAFLNPSDIGGRYSVLSYFGLVPAALIGIDISLLIERADGMRKACAASAAIDENPGAWLGAFMGTMAGRGRDKMTLITSPAISSFGLWVEQLIAESTGKEGKGIIPVAGEPLVEPPCYGDDRFFVYLRLKDDDNAASDAAIADIEKSGQPVATINLRDRHDLGVEFYRWEFATAVAGVLLGINPFDQPDVQKAKDATERMLQAYVKSGHLPQIDAAGSLPDLLSQADEGKYFAIMAYVRQTAETDRAFAGLRRKVVEKHHIVTMLGYGPRFLHSTGQLHKGGPDSGIFLQVTADHERDLPIPGRPYTFGVVADAQAAGDLEALKALGRRIIRIHLSRGDGEALSLLAT